MIEVGYFKLEVYYPIALWFRGNSQQERNKTMKGTDYSKFKYRILTDDSLLHLDEINGTLEQIGKNEDGTYNFI